MAVELFRTPTLDLEDDQVLAEIRSMRADLAEILRSPRRWSGNLRRNTQARAIRGSNSIEGYVISDQDAVAAVDDDEPLSTDERTWAEILGYRRLLTFIVGPAAHDPAFELSSQTIRTMHYMLLEHDLSKSPGQYRPGEIFVLDETTEQRVYEGPPAEHVGSLIDAYVEVTARTDDSVDPMVQGAMAHLNFVMIHPFRDGNGRMARALQTLILTRDRVLEPTFSSIEEWLGANTEDYYRVLAATGAGSWNPQRDSHLWVKFVLRAHHIQAQTLRARFSEAQNIWKALDALAQEHGLPDRALDPLFDATLGLRVRRPTYVKKAEIEDRTATRDLSNLVQAGLLEARGATRGRYYVAGEKTRALRPGLRARRAEITDPYPWLTDRIRVEAAEVARARRASRPGPDAGGMG